MKQRKWKWRAYWYADARYVIYEHEAGACRYRDYARRGNAMRALGRKIVGWIPDSNPSCIPFKTK